MNKTVRTSISTPANFTAGRMAMGMCPYAQTVGERAGT
jgi:hypothetical protein